ncbi:MAG: cytochrome P450 [Anaerolineales bacterium]
MNDNGKAVGAAGRAAKQEIPGPKGQLLMGSLADIQRDRLGFIAGLSKYGPVAKFRVGPSTFIQVSSPDGVQHVLQANNHNYNKKSSGFEPLRDLIGNGLLLSDGDFWLKQRRLMQPVFHRQKIQAFVDMMGEETAAVLSHWEHNAASGEPLNIQQEMMRLTLSVITRALFQERVGDESGSVGKNLTILLADAVYRFEHPLYPPRSIPTRRNRRYRQAKAELYAVIDGLVDRRRGSVGEHNDLLDLLMLAQDEETGEGMSSEQLRYEMVTLFIAGHETTALALSWAFYLLAQHPEARARLQAEAAQVLAGRIPTAADLANLKYARMVLDETMRLYPPAWLTNRRAIGADEIEGYAIPAGAELTVSPYATHHDASLWTEPSKFDPERFAPERSADRHRYAYFPFGGGPRQCIGNNFALMEAQLILAAINQKYCLDLVPGKPVETEALITLRPKDGLWMTVQRV